MSSNQMQPDPDSLLKRAARELLLPLARLCVGRGLPFAQAEELFKEAYVQAAREARRAGGASAARDVSRVATATGLHRREVTRISAALEPRSVQRPAAVTQVFSRWLSDPAFRHRNGRLRRLPRQGAAPSFDSLSQSITRHVHPRAVLDELVRRGLVRLLDDGETVEALTDRIVPTDDQARLFEFLGANAGDHMAAAVDNVLHAEEAGFLRHVEQAIFSNSMSLHGLQKARVLMQQQWTRMLAAVVPALEKMIEDDRTAGRSADHRIRVGLYSYGEPLRQEDEHVPE